MVCGCVKRMCAPTFSSTDNKQDKNVFLFRTIACKISIICLSWDVNDHNHILDFALHKSRNQMYHSTFLYNDCNNQIDESFGIVRRITLLQRLITWV